MNEFPVELALSGLTYPEIGVIYILMCIPKMEEKDWSKITNDEIFQTICADLTRKGILSIDEETRTLNIDL